MTALDRLRANREAAAAADAELPDLVRAAFAEDFSWQDIADVLGVKKARVYQIAAKQA